MFVVVCGSGVKVELELGNFCSFCEFGFWISDGDRFDCSLLKKLLMDLDNIWLVALTMNLEHVRVCVWCFSFLTCFQNCALYFLVANRFEVIHEFIYLFPHG